MKKENLANNVHSIRAKRKAKNTLAKENEQRLDEASLWITKIDRELTKKEQVSLSLWLAKTPGNMEVFLEVAQLWDKTDTLNRLAVLFPQSSSGYQTTSVSKRWKGALAASVALLVSVSILIFSNNPPPDNQANLIANSNLEKTIKTSVGESKTIPLPDGSKLVLNTNTLVEIRFSQHSRVIELERGELHVDVAHDKSRPLSILVAGKIIQAVGTAFNVEVRNNIVELIVTDGKVLVADFNHPLEEFSADMGAPLPKSSISISKGEKINLKSVSIPNPLEHREEVIHIEPVDIAASLSWRTGNLIFRGESLVEAMAEIGRYNNMTIELDDDVDLKMIRVAGMFKTGDINGLLNALEQNFNIHHQQISEHKIFLKLSSK